MRLKLKLSSHNSTRVAINYNYSLSSAIYQLLNFGSSSFSKFLHDIGFVTSNKTYKLFSFSLQLEKYLLDEDAFILKSPVAYLYITTPLVDDFIKNFVIGTFENQRIEIMADNIFTYFKITQAEILPSPVYTHEMKFKMITPLVLSTGKLVNGKFNQYYFRYNDSMEEINRVFNQNLINKYKVIHKKDYSGTGVKINWDEGYIEKALKKDKRLSKKVSILKDIKNPVEVIGIFCPFTIRGDIELIKIGYECGFGEKNSMGFGMVDVFN